MNSFESANQDMPRKDAAMLEKSLLDQAGKTGKIDTFIATRATILDEEREKVTRAEQLIAELSKRMPADAEPVEILREIARKLKKGLDISESINPLTQARDVHHKVESPLIEGDEWKVATGQQPEFIEWNAVSLQPKTENETPTFSKLADEVGDAFLGAYRLIDILEQRHPLIYLKFMAPTAQENRTN